VNKILAEAYDKDKNGYISRDEFEELLKILVANDPKLKNTSFEEFLVAADANKDGKVSIDECAAWIEKYVKME